MEKDLIAHFINAGSEVLFELLQEKPSVEKVYKIERTSKTQGIAIIIGITGDMEGRIIIDIAPDTAHKISEIILQESLKSEDTELIESAVGELANMIAGRAVSILNELGTSLKITPPTTFSGQNLKITDKMPQVFVVPLNTKVGKIMLNLSITAV